MTRREPKGADEQFLSDISDEAANLLESRLNKNQGYIILVAQSRGPLVITSNMNPESLRAALVAQLRDMDLN